MKIIGIHVSPRGKESKTLVLTRAVLAGAKDCGAEVELIDLYGFHIGYCMACGACYATGSCTLLDDFSDIYDMLTEADGIVLGAPNYINSVPAPLKALFDRFADVIHCQKFYGKFGCSVCTAGGSGEMEVVGYMNNVLSSLGVTVVGGVGVAIGWNPDALAGAEQSSYELGKKLVQSINGEHSYPDQEEAHLKRRSYFCNLVKSNRERFSHEYDWYVEKGWMT